VVITKIDHHRAEFDDALAACRDAFGGSVAPLYLPVAGPDGGVTGLIGLLSERLYDYSGSARTERDPDPADADRLRVNVHVCEVGSDWEWRHPAFRDHLRAHRADRDAYERLKRSLAARFGEDIDAYAGAKTAFIRPIEGALRRERGTPAIGTNRPAEVDRRSGRGSGHG
jgi:hypothetical protein